MDYVRQKYIIFFNKQIFLPLIPIFAPQKTPLIPIFKGSKTPLIPFFAPLKTPLIPIYCNIKYTFQPPVLPKTTHFFIVLGKTDMSFTQNYHIFHRFG